MTENEFYQQAIEIVKEVARELLDNFPNTQTEGHFRRGKTRDINTQYITEQFQSKALRKLNELLDKYEDSSHQPLTTGIREKLFRYNSSLLLSYSKSILEGSIEDISPDLEEE